MEKTKTVLWHTLSVEKTFSLLHSSPSGLNNQEVLLRQKEYGSNQLQVVQKISIWSVFFAQFKNVLIVILLLAVAVSAFLGHGLEAVTIGIIVLFAVFLGFFQEYRAEKAIEALKKMAAPLATVFRDGSQQEIPSIQLVPGDLILLREGAKIPADGRLIESFNLKVEESALTGESMPVEKTVEVMEGGHWALGDLKNRVFGGTIVTYGRAKALVTAVGMQSEFGHIAQMLQAIESSRTPLQENLDRVGRSLAKAALVLVLIIVGIGLFRGQPFVEMLIFCIALAVAVVPEALPAVVTISLAIGVQKMVKRHALIRRLPAVETLGSTTVICSDKTGTLTKDQMTVREIRIFNETFQVSGSGYDPDGKILKEGSPVGSHPLLNQLLTGAVLASDARLLKSDENLWVIQGDPTEGALVVAAEKFGLKKDVLNAQFPRIDEIPFSSESKRMTTLHSTPQGTFAYAKGAPEMILESCSHQLTSAGEVTLTEVDRKNILSSAETMAKGALRVLALAFKPNTSVENAEKEMVFLGLFGMIDPPRPEAKEAIEKCVQAGIRSIMITGDHPLTAQAIAQELGLLKDGKVITGAELEKMDEETFEKEVELIHVYARVSPAHKLRVVTALQKKGHIVAMTGDGVNDAPALKKADIGIAMGITGTDVTKEASAMMLMDDNFASIVAAVEEGRGIFGNIKKYLMYLLSSNIGEIGLMLVATLLGLPLPLSAVQILYVNLATDGLPALALAFDPPEADLMKQPPRDSRAGIFTRPVVLLMLVGGLWSTLVNLGIFLWFQNNGHTVAEAMGVTFVALVLIEFVKAYAYRSERHSAFYRPFANLWLNLSILLGLVLLGFIIYLPVLQQAFGTHSMSFSDLVTILGLAFTVLPVLELTKWIQRRWPAQSLRLRN